jgi:hypothetical protein
MGLQMSNAPKLRERLTYANVMVTILAFIVLGGSAYAAFKLPKNSVGTKQIKPNAVNGSKVKNGSLTGADIEASSLGSVPHAANADLLGGSASSAFLKSADQISGGDLTATYGAPQIKNGAVGPSKIGSLPAASLGNPIYNVDVSDNDCQGTNSTFPTTHQDDIDFASVGFDNGGLASKPNSANNSCFNGFNISATGTYIVTASIFWEPNATGDRKIELVGTNPTGPCCALDVSSEEAANPTDGATHDTRLSTSGIARLEAGASVAVLGFQTSGTGLSFFGGNLQIAWIGP